MKQFGIFLIVWTGGFTVFCAVSLIAGWGVPWVQAACLVISLACFVSNVRVYRARRL